MAGDPGEFDDLLDSALDGFGPPPAASAAPSTSAEEAPARAFDPLASAKAANPKGKGKGPVTKPFDPLGTKKQKAKKAGGGACPAARPPPAAAAAAGAGGATGLGPEANELAEGLSKMFEGLATGGAGGEGAESLEKLLGGSMDQLLGALGGAGGGLPPGGFGGGADPLAATLEQLQQHGPPRPPGMPGAEGAPPGMTADQMADDMMKHFAGMAGGEQPEMQAMMDQMMQHLLSKEVLYEPMSEIREKYPKWLEENRDSLSAEDLDRYTRQQRHIADLCAVYESSPGDFQRIVELMQEMQGCGHPPEAIVRELAPNMQMGPDGVPTFPGLPGAEQCTIQ